MNINELVEHNNQMAAERFERETGKQYSLDNLVEHNNQMAAERLSS
jgi:hypothetical protein